MKLFSSFLVEFMYRMNIKVDALLKELFCEIDYLQHVDYSFSI